MNDLRVAAIQPQITWLAPEENLTHLAELIQSVHENTDLIVLPEMFTSGFTQKPESTSRGDQAVSWMKDIAQQYQAAVVGSVAYQQDQNQFVNRLFFVIPDGDVVFYDKVHLFTMAGEHKRYLPGRNRRVVNYKGWRLLLTICYDLRFPVFCRNQADYDAMLCVANWPATRKQAWRTLLQARAIENQAYVVGVNRVGEDGNGLIYNGDSMVIDYQGVALADGYEGKENVLQAQLSATALIRARQEFPVAQDADAFTLTL